MNEINVNNYLSALRKKLNDIMANISQSYYNESDELSEFNYQTQKISYQESIKEIKEDLEIYEEKLEKLQRKNPVNYLINEQKEIYCFNKYGDLVNIIDSVGNVLSIEYVHNKIYRIVSDDEECLTFKYKNDVLVELKNNAGDRTVFTYDDGNNLIGIKRNNENICLYYNDKHLLTEILDDKYTGYQFSYNEDSKISKFLEITYTSKIADETLQTMNTCIAKNTTSIVYHSLNKVTVYNGIADENLSTTYVYDDDSNIKYIEYEYFDDAINQKAKKCILYDYVKNEYRIEARVKNNKINLLESQDFAHLNKNGQYYTLIGDSNLSSVANISIPKERLENYSYLILSVDAIANSLFIKKESQHYRLKSNSSFISNHPKFEIKFETVYTNGEIDVQSQPFDWNISEEQNLFFPVLVNPKYKKEYHPLPTEVPILLDSGYEIQEYVISIDYSNNNEELLFRNLCLREGEFAYQKLNEDDLVIFECDETNLYEKYNEYDEKRLIKETIIQNDKQFDTVYHYDKDGNLLDTTNHLGIVTEHNYNDQKIETITTTYHKDEPIFKFYQEKTIDEEGNLVEEKDETGLYTTQYKYDDKKAHIAKIIKPNGAIIHYHQTPDYRVVSQSMVIDNQPNTNTRFYNKGLLTKLVNSKLKYQFEYDGFGRKTKIIVNDNPYCTIHYDDKNKKQTKKYASETGFVYTTNQNGELIQIDYLDENNQIHPYLTKEYNENGKIIKKKEYNNHLCYNETTYDYDESENLTCIICDNYQIDNEYDNLNRIKKETISMEENIESYQYIYDDEDEIKEVVLPNTKKQTKTKDVYGRTKTITYDNLKTDYEYKRVEEHLTNLVENYNITTPNQTINYTYTYDEIGNIKTIKENQEEVITYEYDKASRLVKENNKKLGFTKEYIYDEIGNIISIQEYNYLNQEQQSKTIQNVYDEIEYDIEGNPTRYQDKEIVFDKTNLVQYGTTTYQYDTNKIRKAKTTNNLTTTYITIEDRIIEEKNSQYHIRYYYGINGIISFKCNEKEYKYIKDITNNIIGIVDDRGTIVARYIYDGWGNHIVIDEEGQENQEETFIGNINPIRYKGYYYDKETQLFYCNSRYYSPELCRFISPDSIEYLDPQSINGLNLYCYCMNNPIMYADPSGHSVILAMLIGAGIGLLVGLGSQLASDVISNVVTNGFDFSEWEMSSWQTYVGAGLGGAIGGALTPFLGPVATGFITGASSTAISMGLSNVTGASNYSLGEIFATSLLIGSVSGITAGILDNVKIPGVNSGRGSLTAVSKQINTKLVNGSIKNVSIKTIGKMAALNAIYSAPFTAFNGLFTNGVVLSPVY